MVYLIVDKLNRYLTYDGQIRFTHSLAEANKWSDLLTPFSMIAFDPDLSGCLIQPIKLSTFENITQRN